MICFPVVYKLGQYMRWCWCSSNHRPWSNPLTFGSCFAWASTSARMHWIRIISLVRRLYWPIIRRFDSASLPKWLPCRPSQADLIISKGFPPKATQPSLSPIHRIITRRFDSTITAKLLYLIVSSYWLTWSYWVDSWRWKFHLSYHLFTGHLSKGLTTRLLKCLPRLLCLADLIVLSGFFPLETPPSSSPFQRTVIRRFDSSIAKLLTLLCPPSLADFIVLSGFPLLKIHLPYTPFTWQQSLTTSLLKCLSLFTWQSSEGLTAPSLLSWLTCCAMPPSLTDFNSPYHLITWHLSEGSATRHQHCYNRYRTLAVPPLAGWLGIPLPLQSPSS